MTMKSNIVLTTALATLLVASGAALATDATKENRAGSAVTTPTASTHQRAATGSLDASIAGMTAEQLIGKDIYDAAGKEVGEIEDIVINRQGQAVSALADVGGFLGIGEKRVVLDLSAMKLQNDRLTLQTMNKESIESLPEYSESNWQRYGRTNRVGG